MRQAGVFVGQHQTAALDHRSGIGRIDRFSDIGIFVMHTAGNRGGAPDDFGGLTGSTHGVKPDLGHQKRLPARHSGGIFGCRGRRHAGGIHRGSIGMADHADGVSRQSTADKGSGDCLCGGLIGVKSGDDRCHVAPSPFVISWV